MELTDEMKAVVEEKAALLVAGEIRPIDRVFWTEGVRDRFVELTNEVHARANELRARAEQMAPQPPTPYVQREHYSLSFNQLLSLAGIEGHITRVWTEDAIDYLHFMVEPGVCAGNYAEERVMTSERVGDKVTRKWSTC